MHDQSQKMCWVNKFRPILYWHRWRQHFRWTNCNVNHTVWLCRWYTKHIYTKAIKINVLIVQFKFFHALKIQKCCISCVSVFLSSHCVTSLPCNLFYINIIAYTLSFLFVVLIVFRFFTWVQLFPCILTNLSLQILDGVRNLINDGVKDIAADGLQQDPTEEETRIKYRTRGKKSWSLATSHFNVIFINWMK